MAAAGRPCRGLSRRVHAARLRPNQFYPHQPFVGTMFDHLPAAVAALDAASSLGAVAGRLLLGAV
ncbi:hypothetical protein FQA18_19090, partial [Haloferax volcanii]